MELIIDVKENKDSDKVYGWYVYGYIVRDNNTISEYTTDLALLNVLNLVTITEYREILNTFGDTTLVNGKTTFKTKPIAKTVIPKIISLINHNIKR